MYIIYKFPDVPSHNTMFMLESMTFKIAVQLEDPNIDPEKVIAHAWTNIYHKDNPEGKWHAIPLELICCKPNDNGQRTLNFGGSVMLTSNGTYHFTFRVRRRESEDWLWAEGFDVNGTVEVRPPFEDRWSQGPDYNKIIGPVHLGNFIAASIADQLEFDAVLNVADTLDLISSKFSRPVDYKKIPLRDGAVNPIPPDMIKEAVEWLQQREKTYKKILVNCRAGIGRAGSIVVAYVFATNKSMSYSDAFEFVYSKRFVYPHKDLKDTLYNLYPR